MYSIFLPRYLCVRLGNLVNLGQVQLHEIGDGLMTQTEDSASRLTQQGLGRMSVLGFINREAERGMGSEARGLEREDTVPCSSPAAQV